MPRPKGSKNKPLGSQPQKRHSKACKICRHPEKDNIELLYTHYVPWRVIRKLFNLSDINIHNHALATDLNKLRDRKMFYQHILCNYNPDKISAENAIEAAKQLDRIERVVQDNPTPANIVVQYSWGKALENKQELRTATDNAQLRTLTETPKELSAGITDDSHRLPAPADSGEVPPLQEAV